MDIYSQHDPSGSELAREGPRSGPETCHTGYLNTLDGQGNVNPEFHLAGSSCWMGMSLPARCPVLFLRLLTLVITDVTVRPAPGRLRMRRTRLPDPPSIIDGNAPRVSGTAVEVRIDPA